MSLWLHDSIGDDENDDGCVLGEAAAIVDSSFFEELVGPFFLSLFVEVDSAFFLFGDVDPPLTKAYFAVGRVLN